MGDRETGEYPGTVALPCQKGVRDRNRLALNGAERGMTWRLAGVAQFKPRAVRLAIDVILCRTGVPFSTTHVAIITQ